MHKIAATPGGWNPEDEGVIFIEQNPAPIVFLTSADTEIQTLAIALRKLHQDFPDVRVANLLNLQQQLTIDTYVENVLSQATIIIVRLLGGIAYWSYGLERLKETAEYNNTALFVLPGDDNPDPDLISHSTVKLSVVNNLWRYFIEGGVSNYTNALQFISDRFLATNYAFQPPQIIPRLGIYLTLKPQYQATSAIKNTVGILFYRSHYLAGNTLPIDDLCQALLSKNLNPLPIFISSLKDIEIQSQLIDLLQEKSVAILLNTTSFAVAKIGDESATKIWLKLDLPILQVILSSSTEEQWRNSLMGLTPRDVAMNVALPEIDGRIITRAISFKTIKQRQKKLETDVVVYQPNSDRIDFVIDLTANWVKLQTTPNSEKNIALILANYPNKDGRIANGVGLDTPASCIEILKALKKDGYFITDIPQTGDDLIKLLTTGVTNDRESQTLRKIYQSLSVAEYQKYFATLPIEVQQGVINRWGYVYDRENGSKGFSLKDSLYAKRYPLGRIARKALTISGVRLGNIFIGIQPSRGYDRDPSLNYHAPDLEPTHDYLAYYYWLREKFQANAIIHVGKHGNLEWLPGKSLALSNTCYPEVTLQAIPHIYPFIVNDPGEGSQAKRRAHAVIIDHLTPPLTRAELYGGLDKLEALIDEYYEAQTLDPTRLKTISNRIEKLVKQEHLDRELDITTESITEFLTIADGYLCELKEAQIRDGLHILGQCPQGTQLRDLIIAISRFSSINQLGLTQAIAKDLGLETIQNLQFKIQNLENLENKISTLQLSEETLATLRLCVRQIHNQGDITEILETIAAELVDKFILNPFPPHNDQSHFDKLYRRSDGTSLPNTNKKLHWIKTHLLPSLQQTSQEITNLLHALEGKYVPSGASGAPTRGRPEVLPTGRNFYSVDIRAIPTETAWEVGSAAAETLIERYTQENGEYPQTLAISIWGTSTMRTGGDDIAQVMALMGVRPVWDGLSRRVVDFEILDESVLNRPRVDVTIRVSGFFRDSFPNILNLLNNITQAIAQLQEPTAINPLAAKVIAETTYWQSQGLTSEQAKTRANYRIFGSKPGAYGAGLQGLIEAQNWQTEADLARAYINWSSYAYDAQGKGHSAPESFQQRLQNLQIVLQNQDNREHDLLDSDDYYQFQGGLTAAVKSVTGKNPEVYFGDNSQPNNPKVRKLTEEIARVYRSRVINPKWIKGVMRHGYKGAFEMAATVDYLFAYDATTKCVSDYMYQGVAEAYILDEQVQQFIQDKNPWALRDMAERLLEANQRGMWNQVSNQMLDELKAIVNEAEGEIENLNY
ncbi:Aerobic cobaltochelatase subunit CobN [Hyella patelloides LEGE 07179]|uniref:Aerobic cobaltochelatase subunit CobN n=1 Tax=Hyella patelloides LEGE 07179 TaxID=945734 RepID=A0A563VUA0_9CYAN|nr:cobaltochelatase subunit CobN [Hyella patelloides]VEP14983.1 Aerobic cobaltochelatase subunit CobN [Hyella patelloides LEGE 07179]